VTAEWMDFAMCGAQPGFLDLPEDQQKATCGHCFVQNDCLDWALQHERNLPPREIHLVFGGRTPAERVALLKRRNL